ncbi:HalOD1 output domain-containing protein [Natronobeatus ordinarius]|uniref:HalOD1 output domain-containing protein n=1 Tax=Natronobeatus ordinarius TaxID=2963433 RepID=UPI0020CF87A9|nr:HalOD1 output domain-containing protein [Natronobeatus ordinarius]
MLLAVERSERSRSLSFEIIEAIAEREGVEATDVEPPEYEALYDVINPEALDALFAPREDGTPRANGRVTFTFCGYDVTVSSDGTIELRE